MCFFPLPLLHPLTDTPETAWSWMGLGSAPAQPLLQLQGNTNATQGSSASRQGSCLTAAQQDTQAPAFAILNRPGVMMEREHQEPRAGSAGEALRQGPAVGSTRVAPCSHSTAAAGQRPHPAQALTTSGAQ